MHHRPICFSKEGVWVCCHIDILILYFACESNYLSSECRSLTLNSKGELYTSDQISSLGNLGVGLWKTFPAGGIMLKNSTVLSI